MNKDDDDTQMYVAQSQWVGLTDEELSEVYNKYYTAYLSDNVEILDVFLIARAVEAKLKGKNGG